MLHDSNPVSRVTRSASSRKANHESGEAPRLARGPVGVNSLIGRLTRPVLGQRGFADADVITHWPTIVGTDLAAMAYPLSLKYTRGAQRSGATLLIRVASGAAATMLQLKAPQIMERVNHYFGYRAVAHVQVSIGPMPSAAKARQPSTVLPVADVREAIEHAVAGVGSDGLRHALSRLGAAVHCRNKHDNI